MRISYDQERDVLGLAFFGEKPDCLEVVESGKSAVFLGFDPQGRLMGIEIVGAAELIPGLPDFLASLERASLAPSKGE